MKYLVDPAWVASWLNGQADATTLLRTLAPDGIAISLVTFGEIYEGIFYGRNPSAAERVFRQFLRGAPVLPLNRTIMRGFARIRGELRARGQVISDTDILIGATASYHRLILVTRNTRHFGRIAGLTLY